MLRVGLPKPSLFRLIPPVMLVLYKKLPFNWISPLSERLTAPFSYPSLVLLDSHRVRFHLSLFFDFRRLRFLLKLRDHVLKLLV